MMLHYVVVTVIALLPVDGRAPGDVVMAEIIGASSSAERCKQSAADLDAWITAQGAGRFTVAADCVEMPAEVARLLGFEPV